MTYLTPVQENKIVTSMANKRNRWKLEEKHKDEAVGITVRNMANEDGRVSNAAVANLIRMEAQNQADEHKAQPDLVDINVHSQILEDPDFYGNYDQLAKIAEASGTDPFASHPVQANDLRPLTSDGRRGSEQ